MQKTIKNGIKIPQLGFGTWEIGGRHEADTAHDDQAIKALKSAIDTGFRHFDTAEAYGAGHAEELLGAAIQASAIKRFEFILTSKVSARNLAYDDLLRSCEGSLKRLQTDYLDMYLIHEVNPEIPMEVTFKALDRLVEEKIIRSYGVSNFEKHKLMKAQKFAGHPIAQNQVEYNLWVREKGMHSRNMESEILPYCQKHGILFNAWRPLNKGKFTANGLLGEMALHYSCQPAQIALAWLLQKQGVITIVKSLDPKHMKENLLATEIRLHAADVEKLDRFVL